jgi:hypothetical protein
MNLINEISGDGDGVEWVGWVVTGLIWRERGDRGQGVG